MNNRKLYCDFIYFSFRLGLLFPRNCIGMNNPACHVFLVNQNWSLGKTGNFNLIMFWIKNPHRYYSCESSKKYEMQYIKKHYLETRMIVCGHAGTGANYFAQAKYCTCR